ncbi:MAG: N-acetylneuraminate lyase [Planctomycetota bacterium]
MTAPDLGVWPALLTPLDEHGQPDFTQLEKLIACHVSQQLGGLYVLGSTGQGVLLSLEQRKSVAEFVIKTVARRMPVMVHVGAVATDDAVELARHAASKGADSISSVATIYYPLGADYTFEHYRRIGGASDLPFYVYHLSAVNRFGGSPREYVDRLLSLPNIRGMKFTDGDLYQLGMLHRLAGDRLQLFSGADELMCHATLCGVQGAIGTFYNLWGPECQFVRRVFMQGDFARGRDFMLVFQQTIHEVLSGGTWSFLQLAMQLRYGIEIGRPRPPLGTMERPWKAEDVQRLMANVQQAAAVRSNG